jgi:hypothetical protein
LTVNFTNIPDDEFYKLMYDANREIAHDYYEHMKKITVDSLGKVYFDKDFDFRGVRH